MKKNSILLSSFILFATNHIVKSSVDDQLHLLLLQTKKPTMQSSIDNFFDLLDRYIQEGANINENNNGKPLLFQIITSGRFFHAHALLSYGANVCIVDKKGNTALHILSSLYSNRPFIETINMVNNLIDHGANINQQNNEGNTPFLQAIINDDYYYAQILRQTGANITIINNQGFAVSGIELNLLDAIAYL